LKINFSCMPERMGDTNKLLYLVWQELRKISGTAKEEEKDKCESQIKAHEDKINAMSRAEMMAEIKTWTDDDKPEGWTKMKTDVMRDILLKKGGDGLV